MDPATKLRFDSPLLRVYEDGRVERFFGTETTPPGFDAATGVTSKDVVIDATTGVFARLYIPDLRADSQPKKLPILVYFHGGGLLLDSASNPTYHRYLNTLVSKAGVLAVSVNYRLAPEHPIPAAYEDSWTALSWAASRDDPWLSEHSDAGRIFLAGDSGGANIVHNIAIMAGGTRDGLPLPPGTVLEGAIVMHPMLGGKEAVDGEDMYTREIMEKLWPMMCPESTDGLDDPRLNPMARGAPSLQQLACRRLLVCSADLDLARPRAAAYYEAVKASGWRGTAEWMESTGEEHVFFLSKPECDESLKLMDRVIAFIAGN
uniref:Uncharacterized protein n=1 Tax=Avena sativa TaxID=4498 RepID=A0ACD5YEH0_AVESA